MRITFIGSDGITYLTAITRAWTFSGQLKALGITPGAEWYRNTRGEVWDRATGDLIGIISADK